MAIIVYRRPQGYTLTLLIDGTVPVSAVLGGDKLRAIFFLPSHGRTDGQVIYIKSEVENYNGFFYINVIDANQFSIQSIDKPYAASDSTLDIEFIKTIEIATIYRDYFTHGWNCVHLPIVYRLYNDLWPTNFVDTVRSILSVTDSNGYCSITTDGDIKATGSAAALEFIKISGNTSFSGVYQIISYSSETSFVISLKYSAAIDSSITGQPIQYYYNNYNVRVRVYGGIPDGHTFNTQRPYVQILELKLTPNVSNVCAFSVSDILKSQITTDNNTLLGTLPNNINNWTAFYIEYAEAYDVATAGVLVNTVGTYTSDKSSFEGYAVNAELPFKNVYSGAMSDYVSGDLNQKFLTLFDEPVKFSGKYFDIGFISTFFQTFTNESLADFTNNSTGTAWTLSATPSVTLADGASSQLLSASFSKGFKSGVTYRVGVNINYTGASTTVLTASIEAAANTNVNFIQTFLNPGANVFTVDLTAAGNYNFLVFRVVDVAGAGGGDYGLNNYWIYPVDDPSYAQIELRQGGLSSIVDAFDEGVYRVQLEEPNCNASSMEVSLGSSLILPLDPPGAWTDDAGWTSKTFIQFNLTDASWPPGPSGSHTNLVAATGDVIKLSIPVTLTGTVNGSVGFSIYLTDATGAISRSNEVIGLLTPAQSPQTFDIVLTATGTVARIYIVAGAVSGATGTSGTVDLTLTLPETYTLSEGQQISETKTIKIDCNCAMPQAEGGMVLSWLNYLGGYDHWFFTTEQEKQINILETAQTDDNIFPSWPNSYGEFARGITRQTYRKAKNRIKLTSQLCTLDQLKGLQYLKTSPVVTITNSIYDTRIIIPDQDSFTIYNQGDKQYTISFYAEFTDLIPSQRR